MAQQQYQNQNTLLPALSMIAEFLQKKASSKAFSDFATSFQKQFENANESDLPKLTTQAMTQVYNDDFLDVNQKSALVGMAGQYANSRGQYYNIEEKRKDREHINKQRNLEELKRTETENFVKNVADTFENSDDVYLDIYTGNKITGKDIHQQINNVTNPEIISSVVNRYKRDTAPQEKIFFDYTTGQGMFQSEEKNAVTGKTNIVERGVITTTPSKDIYVDKNNNNKYDDGERKLTPSQVEEYSKHLLEYENIKLQQSNTYSIMDARAREEKQNSIVPYTSRTGNGEVQYGIKVNNYIYKLDANQEIVKDENGKPVKVSLIDNVIFSNSQTLNQYLTDISDTKKENIKIAQNEAFNVISQYKSVYSKYISDFGMKAQGYRSSGSTQMEANLIQEYLDRLSVAYDKAVKDENEAAIIAIETDTETLKKARDVLIKEQGRKANTNEFNIGNREQF